MPRGVPVLQGWKLLRALGMEGEDPLAWGRLVAVLSPKGLHPRRQGTETGTLPEGILLPVSQELLV